MLLYPLINGSRYDWSSVEIKVRGRILLGAKELSYKGTRQPGKGYGTSAQKQFRTRGQYDAEGSITLYKAEATELLDALGNGYMEVPFDIVVSYAERGQPPTTDTLVGCEIIGDDDSGSEGSDPLVTKFDLDLMYILRNGKTPLLNLRR